MTRDTPLLEFSQVRATPIDSTPLPLCLPSKLNESFSFSPSFCCSFNLSKKERWTQKSLLGGIWRWARGKEGVPDRRGEEQRSLWVCVWMREVAESEQPALAARSRSFPPALGPEGLPSEIRSSITLAVARSSGRCLIGLTHRALARGCRRWGAAPQWISGWHGGGSLLGVCALPWVPACLF